MTNPIIVVLEDMEPRIEWLKARFPDAEILWSTTVDGFFEHLRCVDRSRVILFLLDHDLGGAIDSQDVSGKTGLDAVKGLGSWKDIPAIVWSINSAGATSMVKELRDLGFIVAWSPFHKARLPSLEAAIRSQVTP